MPVADISTVVSMPAKCIATREELPAGSSAEREAA